MAFAYRCRADLARTFPKRGKLGDVTLLQISVLILSPTRELAQQIAEEASQLTKFQPGMAIQARERTGMHHARLVSAPQGSRELLETCSSIIRVFLPVTCA